MKRSIVTVISSILTTFFAFSTPAATIQITDYHNGRITWSTDVADATADYTVEWTDSLTDSNWHSDWRQLTHQVTTNQVNQAAVPMFFRVTGNIQSNTYDLIELIHRYSNAVADIAIVDPSELYPYLEPVREDNTNTVWRKINGTSQVKVVSFMSYSTATQYYGLGWHNLSFGDQWVTLCPQLENFLHSYAGTNAALRVKQLLGLPPTAGNDTAVELWVSPEYLIRPSPDLTINSAAAGLPVLTNSQYITSYDIGKWISTNFIAWYTNTYNSRNFELTSGGTNSWPWTRLGYTYDWALDTNYNVGLSEYVIPSGYLSQKFGVAVPVEIVTITNISLYGHQQ